MVSAPEPLPSGFFGLESATSPEPEQQGWIGAEFAINESDSLESLDLQPGLRVTALDSAGPFAQQGVRVGDVMLSFAGVPTDDLERVQQLLRNITQAQSVEVELQRGDEVFLAEVPVAVRRATGLRSLYFVERALWRVAFAEGDQVPYPRIHQLAPDSPLVKAGAEEGDWVLQFQGRDPGSAAELVRRVRRELQPGDEFSVRVRRSDGGQELTLNGRAWMPDRVLQQVGLWPLFYWDRDRGENREVFEVGDLVLFSVFKMRRIGTVKKWSILSLLTWETGVATLQPVGGGQ